jgi:asparagine synthetase B (glutamine-hydrolysing)
MDLESIDAGGDHLLDRVQRWDLETLLAEGFLTKVDRASMNAALELRSPCRDEPVIEFAKSLRVETGCWDSKTKVFLKRYARRYLPDDIVNRRKRGLSVPVGSWLRGPLKEWAAAALEKGAPGTGRDSHVRGHGILLRTLPAQSQPRSRPLDPARPRRMAELGGDRNRLRPN